MTTHTEGGELLSLHDLFLSFGGVQVLRGISFAVGPREICGIIGPNGAGKSALLNLISGLYRASSGRIRYAGVDRARMHAAELGQAGIARTFQNLALFGSLSVRDNVRLGLRAHRRAGAVAGFLSLPHARRDRARADARTDETLALLDLSAHADRIAGILPYGLQKRAELARGLVSDPRLLLLDEPFAGMEAHEKHELASLIGAAHRARGGAILLIEHDIGLVLDLAHRVVVLDHGKLVAEGTPDAIRGNPAVLDAYLGAGRHAALAARPRPGASLPHESAA